MEVIKKIRPGQNGSKTYTEHYGERLICVRYRNDGKNNRNLVTVELIVAEHPHTGKASPALNQLYPHPNRMVLVRVAYNEADLRRQVKAQGGQWLNSKQRWRMPYRVAQELGLSDRVEDDQPQLSTDA